MEGLIVYVHSLATGVLIGKIVLLSFIVAPILARNLERESFGKVVRHLFPAYYALGMGAAMTGLTSVVALGIITALGRTVSGTFDNLNVRVQGPGSLETRVAPQGTVKP